MTTVRVWLHPLKYESCSVSCHHLMTTVRAWLFFSKVCNMLCQVSSSYDNGQSMEIYHSCMKHAPSVAIVLWQRSEHGNRSLRYQSCSDSWHRLMTTVRAWLFISKVLNMLRQLSSWHDNGQSMAIHPKGMKTGLSVVYVSSQRSEYGYLSLRYEWCSVSCHRLMTTVRAWCMKYIIYLWNMSHKLSSPHSNRQSMVIHPKGMNYAPSVVLSHDIGRSMDLYHLGMKHASSVVIVS